MFTGPLVAATALWSFMLSSHSVVHYVWQIGNALKSWNNFIFSNRNWHKIWKPLFQIVYSCVSISLQKLCFSRGFRVGILCDIHESCACLAVSHQWQSRLGWWWCVVTTLVTRGLTAGWLLLLSLELPSTAATWPPASAGQETQKLSEIHRWILWGWKLSKCNILWATKKWKLRHA